ncbi:MAG TPA: hypothetical protein VFF27_08230 [Bacteroidia bacterium]|jgi:hypothetical protein|nr:hypothetical protein [Bacteroidia bacterium]
MPTYKITVAIVLSIVLLTTSCAPQQELTQDASDKQKIIYDVIRLSLTDQKMPAYGDLKHERTVYVYNRYINFMNPAPDDKKEFINEVDIPKKVDGHPVQLISKENMIKHANATGVHEFMLDLGSIQIAGDTASIGIDGTYVSPDAVGGHKMSGGGGIARYVKEDGVWTFKGFTQSWIE